nr:putative oxidoreductase C-terminal domain-containing protein [Membranihabitans maritimus]
MHLDLIDQFNNRNDSPTSWTENVYTGDDFFEKMLADKPGNVMVVAGNNKKKTEYILDAVKNDIHVYADKPMVINPQDYELLKEAMEIADEKGLLVYDIMTERFEVTTMLQKRLSKYPEIFGEFEEGSVENPAITKESVHHFSKEVNGKPLIRPAWFFDVEQQGAGIVDVATHLVDLILWSRHSGEVVTIDQVEVKDAEQWSTELTPSQFEKVTGLKEYPDYLNKDIIKDSVLNVYSNGAFVFTVNGVHGKASVIWNFEAPAGSKDTHFSIMRGTKANLVIRQNKETDFQTILFIEPVNDAAKAEIESKLDQIIPEVEKDFSGISYKKVENGWEVVIPSELKVGHEAHFAQVTRKFLEYMENGEVPEWEKQFMLTKYYLTTRAYEMSRSK